MHIRKATPADLPALARLGALLVRAHHELDPRRFLEASPGTERGYSAFLEGQLARPDAVLVLAELEEEVVGYAYATEEGHDYLSLRGPAGVLHDLIVDPARRNQGIGRRLLDATLAALEARGVPRVVLSTAEQNTTAQRLFAAAGFRRTMIEMTRETRQTDPPTRAAD